MDRSAIEAGYSIYSPASLKIYNFLVHGFSNRWLWRCPTKDLVDLHSKNVASHHLDIGVATGIFLDQAIWPVKRPKIVLMDPNSHCLEFAAKRLARYSPKTLEADVFEPLPTGPRFKSVSLCYLLHCLPGAMNEKAPIVFKNVSKVMEKGGTLFGATILQGDAPRNFAAQRLMNIYNKKGVFSNSQDTFQDLEKALKGTFKDVKIERRGCVALFEAKKKG